ncbi:MAG TPA: ABC transporter substrate-binding protein [Nocardioides sp.]|uniref:ABC transporter substrate-binding protein n=1 Tax=Nocardioides sp. TaxID=35761 RepID=UPI002C19FE85|nr:ABC transporter substrate-binding protein [Nocardioides sp.]HQR27629.1 ABC transporter substrate-binding protein [Nocardioides sp.]
MPALALALCAMAAALGVGAGPAAAAGDDIFTVGFTNEVDSFNPFLGIEAESYEMWGLMYDYLIGYSMEDMSVQPTGLAEEWETSEDGLTWTFRVHDGIEWSDGEPLTAKDVAYTYNRVIDGGPEAATWGSYLGGVESVTAPDDTTVVLTLKKPNAVLPLLPIPIIPEHIWKDVSESEVKSYANEPTDGQPVVGSGPFRLVEGTAGGSTYRFEANPDYWQGAPHIDGVTFRVFKAEDPAAQALIKGEIDFVDEVSPLVVDRLAKEDNVETNLGLSPSFNQIAFNAGAVDLETGEPMGDGNPAVQDPKFRYALGYALDLDQIAAKAFQGAAQPGTTIVPPSFPTFRWEVPEDEKFTFDLEKAGQLLDEAGYTMGDDGLRTMPDGSPIGELRLHARSDSGSSRDTMDFFSEWLAELGIESKVVPVESSKLTQIILDGDFDVFEWGWYVDPDPDSMLSYFTCGQRGNWSDSWYCDKEYDALYEAQRVELDDTKRAEMIKQMQQMLYEDAPYLVTTYDKTGEAYRSDRFEGFRPQPDPGGVWLQQFGTYNYSHITPVAAGDSGEESGTGTGVVVALGVAALAVLGIGAVVVLRRRSSAEDRE